MDSAGRIRMDDWELAPDVQAKVRERWSMVTTKNVAKLADLKGIREDFLKIFGFGMAGVNYEEHVSPTLDQP